MIEIVVGLCLAADPTRCFDRLVPVRAADCETALATAMPRLERWAEVYEVGSPDCIETPAGGLEFREIAAGVFVHEGRVEDVTPANQGDISNIIAIVGEDSIAVVDSGGSRAVGEAAYLGIRAVSDLPISHVVLTHFHPDHVFGATAFADAGAQVVAHSKLADALAARADSYAESLTRLAGSAAIGSSIPAIARGIDHPTDIDLGGRIS